MKYIMNSNSDRNLTYYFCIPIGGDPFERELSEKKYFLKFLERLRIATQPFRFRDTSYCPQIPQIPPH